MENNARPRAKYLLYPKYKTKRATLALAKPVGSHDLRALNYVQKHLGLNYFFHREKAKL